jgi:hypothetical protein
MIEIAYYDGDYWTNGGTHLPNPGYEPTHWMLLPEPPKDTPMNHPPEPWSIYDKCDQLVDANGRHFLNCDGIAYQETEDGAYCIVDHARPEVLQRIVACVNACAQLPDSTLQSLAQHPVRLYAVLKWFKHLSTYTAHDTTGTVCALCHTIDSHDVNCPMPAILQTLTPL